MGWEGGGATGVGCAGGGVLRIMFVACVVSCAFVYGDDDNDDSDDDTYDCNADGGNDDGSVNDDADDADDDDDGDVDASWTASERSWTILEPS